MMKGRRTTILVAILLAIGTGWLTLNYLGQLQRQSQTAGAPRPVVVAATEIPARAPITKAMLAVVERPASAVDPDAVTDPRAIVGKLALITIPTGGTITSSKIGQPGNAALPVRLRPGMRALSIEIDKVKGVSGLLQPGDRVDVIAIPPKVGDQPPPAATILRGIRVLALGNTLEYSSATPSPNEQSAATVTLEVTPSQADLLAMADVNTTLRLALRSPREAVTSLRPETLRFPHALVAGPLAAPPAAAAAAPAAPDPAPQPARAAPSLSSVPVLDGSSGGR